MDMDNSFFLSSLGPSGGSFEPFTNGFTEIPHDPDGFEFETYFQPSQTTSRESRPLDRRDRDPVNFLQQQRRHFLAQAIDADPETLKRQVCPLHFLTTSSLSPPNPIPSFIVVIECRAHL